MAELHASIAWAQRKDQVFLSIDLQDVKDQKIDLQSDKLTFSGVSGGKKYVANVEFFKPIDTEKSKYVVRPRNIDFVLIKKESGPYWDRLLKEAGKQRWLKVDWNKWKDEDEADEEDNFDMGGMNNFDMSALGGMGGMPGMPGMGGMGMPGMPGMGGMNFDDDEEDSDDEEIPGLEEDKPKEVEEEEAKKTAQ